MHKGRVLRVDQGITLIDRLPRPIVNVELAKSRLELAGEPDFHRTRGGRDGAVHRRIRGLRKRMRLRDAWYRCQRCDQEEREAPGISCHGILPSPEMTDKAPRVAVLRPMRADQGIEGGPRDRYGDVRTSAEDATSTGTRLMWPIDRGSGSGGATGGATPCAAATALQIEQQCAARPRSIALPLLWWVLWPSVEQMMAAPPGSFARATSTIRKNGTRACIATARKASHAPPGGRVRGNPRPRAIIPLPQPRYRGRCSLSGDRSPSRRASSRRRSRGRHSRGCRNYR